MEQMTLLDVRQVQGDCLRWNEGRRNYRPAGELFDPRWCGVEEIEESVAKDWVRRVHYSGTYPAARARAALIERRPFLPDRILGVAVFSVPMTQAVIPKYLPIDPNDGVELGRFCLLDDRAAAANAETWFLKRAFRELYRQVPGCKGIVSYCDPLERRDENGKITKLSHRGTIYRAHNANYRGMSKPRTIILSRTGRVVSERALSKLRNGECGASYAYRDMLAMGAPAIKPGESDRDYVDRALLEGGFRRVKHPGNHVFTWLRRA